MVIYIYIMRRPQFFIMFLWFSQFSRGMVISSIYFIHNWAAPKHFLQHFCTSTIALPLAAHVQSPHPAQWPSPCQHCLHPVRESVTIANDLRKLGLNHLQSTTLYILYHTIPISKICKWTTPFTSVSGSCQDWWHDHPSIWHWSMASHLNWHLKYKHVSR